MIEKVAQFVRELETKDPEKVALLVAAKSYESESSEENKEKSQVLASKVHTCLQHFLDAKALPSATKAKPKKNKKQQKNAKATNSSDTEKTEENPKSPPVTNGEAGSGDQGTSPPANVGSPKAETEKKEGSTSKASIFL